MNITERKQFFAFLSSQGEKYDKELATDKLELWWKHLQQNSIEDIISAFDRHSANESKFSKFPTIAQIESLIGTRRIGNGMHSHHGCNMRSFESDNRFCGNPSMFNVGNHEQAFFVCERHYAIHRERSEIDQKIIAGMKDFEKEAAELGLTNRQYHFHKQGKEVRDVMPKELEEIENQKAMAELFKGYSGRRRASVASEMPPEAPKTFQGKAIDWRLIPYQPQSNLRPVGEILTKH